MPALCGHRDHRGADALRRLRHLIIGGVECRWASPRGEPPLTVGDVNQRRTPVIGIDEPNHETVTF
jgi:hypothetical protein